MRTRTIRVLIKKKERIIFVNRKLLSIILSAAIFLTLFPIGVLASADITIDPISAKNPGDSVTVSGTTTLDRVTLQVFKPNGTLFDLDSVDVIDGTYSYTFVIPEDSELAPLGTYSVIAGKGDNIVSTTFVLQETSSDATLRDLTVDGLTIEGFAVDKFEYVVEVPFGTTKIPVVSAISSDDGASVTITQATTVAAYNEEPRDTDKATIVVTARDGVTTLTYTVIFVEIPVTIDPITTKVQGSSVTISGSTVFDRVAIKVVRPDKGILDVDSVPVVDGTYSYTFLLPEDAQLGTYNVVVGRGEVVATTSFVVVERVNAERVIVYSDADEITENKGTMQMYATVEGVGGAPVEQDVIWSVEPGTGTASITEDGLLIALTNGTVTVRATSVVTPTVSGTKVITISGQRSDGLSNLAISPGIIEFDPSVTEYDVVVGADAETITITPTAPEGATVKVNGEVVVGESAIVELQPGKNVITILVEETGKIPVTYTLNVKRMVFSIDEASIDKEETVVARVTISPKGESMNAVVIFKLMDGTTPVAIVAIKDNITETKTYSGMFSSYVGQQYSVKVFVWDELTNDVTFIGEDLADPIILE